MPIYYGARTCPSLKDGKMGASIAFVTTGAINFGLAVRRQQNKSVALVDQVADCGWYVASNAIILKL